MAMMMAGRVLLVCALCVLWCGTAFGHAMEDYCGEGGGDGLRHTSNGGDDGVSLKADCGLLSTRMGLIKAVEAAEAGQESSGPDPPQDKSKESLPNNTNGTGAPGPGGVSVAVPPPAVIPPTPKGSGTEEKGKKSEVVDTSGEKVAGGQEQKDVIEADPQHQSVDQLSSSSSDRPGTESVKQPSSRANSKSTETFGDQPQEEEEEEDEDNLRSETDSHKEQEELVKKEALQKASNEAPTETPGGPTNKEEKQTATTELNGQSSPEALEDVKQPEEVQGEKDSNNNPQTNSVASIAANQHNEPSADHGESTPPSPTANGDAANNEAGKSTEEGIPNSDPAADGAGTREEKQNENKDANPKETPVTAAAMKTTTATTGDSDGSTAASHTTSPLLLLLFACAAAAAVVAA
ncbi:mucin-associated surface protein (MASP) [Trypanosoma cruzi Dm28c]|uniref:Mucin-associated surface protein (MASP) n=2 Tax=Trypanosoma cruzi TaxID=5693 RepID=V5BB68_TRYCR|nr:mucin-associated surface protein (MASP) [Trypanosoma cruzi Dm28c]PBJ76082.1 mucin-associated surface protein [Trypanosoma cruzi cruzi]PWU97472.1 Mucin-associated surface protein (MASP) [Trypanosoma cruzi]